MLRDVGCETAQRGEDLLVALVVGAQLESVLAGNLEGHLEDVDRIETEAFTVQRRGGQDLGRSNFQIERFDQEDGQFILEG